MRKRTAFSLLVCALSGILLRGQAAMGDLTVSIGVDTNAGGYTVSWPTEAGVRYELLASEVLPAWYGVTGFPQHGTGLAMTHAVAAPSTSTFYRVTATTGPGEQQLNLPVADDGLRYDTYAEFEGPSWPTNYGQGHVTLWHDDKFAAYSITIDDNNSPDFPFWLDVADTYGWKLTWFVIVHPYVWDIYNDVPGSNTGYFGTLAEFADLATLGHDIQLHGACSAMNELTASNYADHVTRSITVLEGATSNDVITFAYPCGKTVSSDGSNDYRAVLSDYMIAARGTSGGVTPVHRLDYLNTQSLSVNALDDGGPNSQFSRTWDNTRPILYSAYRGWCVTLYHGLDDTGEANALETFDYVKAHEDEFWVAPFTDVAKYAQERETSTLDISKVSSALIVFRVKDAMDDGVFDHPLTVKLRLDATWTAVAADQAGGNVAAWLVQHDGLPYALVQPRPDRGLVFVRKATP